MLTTKYGVDVKNIIALCGVLFSSTALSGPQDIDDYIPEIIGTTSFEFDNYSVWFDKGKGEPVLAITNLKPKLKNNPVYTRSHLSKFNKTDDAQVRHDKAIQLAKDYSHLSSVYNSAHSQEQVLQGNADVNRIAMPPFFNRSGLWKLSENFAYKKSVEIGELFDLSGVVDHKDKRYFYKVLVSQYSNSTIAFIFDEMSKDTSLMNHITSVDCINSITGYELLKADVFDDIRSDQAYSLDVWSLGDGNYNEGHCEKL